MFVPESGLDSARAERGWRNLANHYPARLDDREMGTQAPRVRDGARSSVFELRL